MNQCCNPDGKITLYQGISFSKTWRWGIGPLVYKAITASPKSTPLRFTVTAHAVPPGWSVAFRDVGGFAGSPNAPQGPLQCDAFFSATVIDANTIELNEVDGGALGIYTSGGQLVYFTPVSLSSSTGQLNIYDTPAALGAVRVPLLSVVVTLDDTLKTIVGALTAVQTAGLLKQQYDYDLTITNGSNVSLLEQGTVESKVRGT